MKKIIAKKGFTLVECVIAIAVFAVMTGMILFIVGNAVTTSKTAREQEKNLNGLVDNVVRDQSPKSYGAYDSNELNMSFTGSAGTKDFKITYSTVDGYKNYVQCPICKFNGSGGLHTMLDFMAEPAHASSAYLNARNAYYETNGDDAADFDTLYNVSHWYDPSTMALKCPDCGTTLSGSSTVNYKAPGSSGDAKYSGTNEYVHATVRLRCLACENEGDYNNSCLSDAGEDEKKSVSFVFDQENGNFICASCNSGNVVQVIAGKPINETTDQGLQISGMSANAIRYTNLEEPEAIDKVKNLAFNGLSDERKNAITTTLTADSTYVTSPTTYRMEFRNITFDGGESLNITISLPGNYLLDITDYSSNLTDDITVTTKAKIEPIHATDYEDATKLNQIRISDLTKSMDYSYVWVEFTLTNYINGSSFDYDFKKEGGLHKIWFGVNGGVETKLIGKADLEYDPKQIICIDESKLYKEPTGG